MNSSLWSRLPKEMITHVLSFLPTKSLSRFKCVSHSWNSEISSPEFAQTHHHITNTTTKPHKTILISPSYALYSLDPAAENPTAKKLCFPTTSSSRRKKRRNSDDKWISVSGSCNGLVLICDQVNSNFLFNPFTTECKKLPKSPYSHIYNLIEWHQYLLRGLGYDSSTDDYKVVILLYREYWVDGENANMAVYSMKTDAWREIKVSHHDYPEQHDGFYFNERLHWVCDCPMILAAFNLSDETFKEIQLPALFDDIDFDYYDDISDHHMAVLGGSLCLVVDTARGETEVWMMKKYGIRDSWTKFMIANPGAYVQRVLCMSAEDECVFETYGKIVDVNGEIVDGSDGGKLVVYNQKKETVRVVFVSGMPTGFKAEENYIETLVSPNHGGQIRRHHEASSGESSKSCQFHSWAGSCIIMVLLFVIHECSVSCCWLFSSSRGT